MLTEQALAEQAQKFEVVPRVLSQSDYESVARDLTVAKSYLASVEDFCRPAINAAHASHKAALAQLKKLSEPAERFEAAAKAAMKKYVLEEQAKARAAEEAARAEARKREEERLAMAAKLESEGKKDEAAVVMETALAPVAPSPALVAPPRAAGTSARPRWKGRVVDITALCRAIGAGNVPAKILSVNEGELNRAADAIANSREWPGVEWYEDVDISARRM